ncbi:porin [Sphingobacterium lactis]|nr:porin [Sphingobacterium lactis]
MSIKGIFIPLLSIGILMANAQEHQNSTAKNFAIGGYIETYYSQDFNQPVDHKKVGILNSHHRSNEIAVNLALLKASYQSTHIRSHIAIGLGTYMQANYAGEDGIWKNVYEANLGFKLSKDHALWLDAGVLPSHIGAESAIGLDNVSLSRSLSAENSPYFETGARLSYETKNKEWYFSVLALNGWQRIAMSESQRGLSFGHQVQYKPSTNILINSSSYVGKEGIDSLRIFHNLYVQGRIGEKWSLLANWDIGLQEQSMTKEKLYWWNAGVQGSYAITPGLRIHGRGEYFKDRDAVVFGSTFGSGSALWGASLGLDVTIYEGLCWRTEYRHLEADKAGFPYKRQDLRKTANHITTAMAWRF